MYSPARARPLLPGADISVMAKADEVAMKDFAALGHGVMSKLEKSKAVCIAAVNGFALGGGLETALACDIRIFSDQAQVGLPEVTLGIIPGFGGTQRLTKQIGAGHAKRLVLTGERIDAQTAYELGIAQKVTTADDLLAEATKVAQTIAKNGPAAIRVGKEVINAAISTDLDLGLSQEAAAFAKLFSTGEPKEGMTAFLEKRKAEF